jgi:hypothetical protein
MTNGDFRDAFPQLFKCAVMQVCTGAGVTVEGNVPRARGVTSAIVQVCTGAVVHACKNDDRPGGVPPLQLFRCADVHVCTLIKATKE